MVNAVNQCLLNQTDFDFLTNANLVSELSSELTLAEGNLAFLMIFDFMVVVAAILIIVLAFMIRDRSKRQSNVLIAVAACGAIVMGSMTYINFNKVETIKSEIIETNTALEAMAQPEIDVFTACSAPDAVLRLAPNRDDPDFKSSYTQAISINKK